ncbi:MAG: hypothetical protein ACFFDN_40095, partial [Candidatus Hodarchaeota archaeon]
KKLEKQKKKEEKEKKLQEEKEKQEKLLEEMRKVKKEKKEKPKKEKKEKPKREKKEKIEEIETKPSVSVPTTPAAEVAGTPSLFQTLTQKTDDTEKMSIGAFVPFIAKAESEAQEESTLRIIPNVSDIERKSVAFTPTQPSVQSGATKPSGKEMITCKQCGAILSSDYAFCNKCGTQL